MLSDTTASLRAWLSLVSIRATRFARRYGLGRIPDGFLRRSITSCLPMRSLCVLRDPSLAVFLCGFRIRKLRNRFLRASSGGVESNSRVTQRVLAQRSGSRRCLMSMTRSSLRERLVRSERQSSARLVTAVTSVRTLPTSSVSRRRDCSSGLTVDSGARYSRLRRVAGSLLSEYKIFYSGLRRLETCEVDPLYSQYQSSRVPGQVTRSYR